MVDDLAFLKDCTRDRMLPWSAHCAATKHFGLSHAAIEVPTVISCGELGGYIIEGLALRGGVQIVAIDPDVFEEHNLKRLSKKKPHNLEIT